MTLKCSECARSSRDLVFRRHNFRLLRHINSDSLINPLKTKRRLLYLKTQFVPCSINTFHLGYKIQPVYAVSGTSRCLFSDKYKTNKYSVGRAYSCWMLNCWCITWPVGFKRLTVMYFLNNDFDYLITWFNYWCYSLFNHFSVYRSIDIILQLSWGCDKNTYCVFSLI